MALPKDRQCFYCKESFQSSVFHAHLKHCEARNNRKNNASQPSDNTRNKQSCWTCPHCTFQNNQSSKACIVCQTQNNEEKSSPQTESNKQTWQCNSCTYVNNDGSICCDICLNPRPGYESKQNNNNNTHQTQDDATLKYIEQFLCVVCKQNEGYNLECDHKLCTDCAKQYIEQNGRITCPHPLGCEKNGTISDYVIKSCNFSKSTFEKCEQMKKEYIISSDKNITSCPNCKRPYFTEDGDMKSIDKNEKGPHDKILSYAHLQHKAKHRFRCETNGCKTIFCSGCQTVPYHIGYTCNEYKKWKQCRKCRFCEVSLNKNNTAPKDRMSKTGLENVCNAEECLEKREWNCDLKHQKCGHNCIGLRGYKCMACLNKKCVANKDDINDDEFCQICWTDPLRAAPCVQLQCGHYFHFVCVRTKINKRWPAARITFGFLNCPLCKQEMVHPALNDIKKEFVALKRVVQKDAVNRLKLEKLDNDEKLKNKSSPYYNNVPKYAMDRLAFYLCSKCNEAYFGGLKRCEEAGMEQNEDYNKNHLICGSCASGPNAKSCQTHGKKYITYKCKFCCSVSSWFCWGNTHFCDACHTKQAGGDYLNRKKISELPKCKGKGRCPLGIEHPPNGNEYSLGCVVCLRK